MKVCKTCKVEKPFEEFHRQSKSRDNCDPHCKECALEKARAYYQKNKQAAKDRATKWRLENPEAQARSQAKHYRKYPEKRLAVSSAYRARKRDAIPPWFCKKAVDAIYANSPKGWEVDHIQSLASGGTHSQDNLQYLPMVLNRMKGKNKMIEVLNSDVLREMFP